MKTIILSAFRTFGDYTANSTELVAKLLNETSVGEFTLYSILFDANIPKENRGVFLFSIAQKLKASGIISLGMASEKTGLCIEQIAVNKISNLKYCPPDLNETKVDINRPYEEQIHMNIQPWNTEIFKKVCAEKNIPIMQNSNDAGGFCCNHLAYQARIAQKENVIWNKVPFIFVHTPCSPETLTDIQKFYSRGKTTMSVEKIAEGIKTLILTANL